MKKRIFKIAVAALLVAVMVLSLFSCAGKKQGDASGGWEGLSWTFKDGVLSITGSGAMPTAPNAASVGWASVKAGVEKVVFYPLEGKQITSISSYAFHGMAKLTEVSIPNTVTSIGKAAFAFCSSLKSVSLPDSLTSVGDCAFEGCVALESINVPANVTSLGARSFAFCKALKSVLVEGAISSIGEWTFKDCAALEKVTVRDTFDKSKISANAFEGAKIGADKISTTDAIGQAIIVSTYYKDEAGIELKAPLHDETKQLGDQYSLVAPTIDGYTLIGEQTVTGKIEKAKTEITFTYKKNAETEAPAETDAPKETTPAPADKEKNSVTTIIALVIFGVVLVAICVGAFLLIRADKKQKKNGNTVRKSDSDKKKSKRK